MFRLQVDISVHGHDMFSASQALNMSCPRTEMSARWWLLWPKHVANLTVLHILLCFDWTPKTVVTAIHVTPASRRKPDWFLFDRNDVSLARQTVFLLIYFYYVYHNNYSFWRSVKTKQYMQQCRVCYMFRLQVTVIRQTFQYMDMTCSVLVKHWPCHVYVLKKSCPCTEMSAWWWLLVTETCSKFYIIAYIFVFWLNDILVKIVTIIIIIIIIMFITMFIFPCLCICTVFLSYLCFCAGLIIGTCAVKSAT